ncbi:MULTISPECIES: response regulator [Flavobacterium]|uniref:Response regulator n=1 Tax=Flavobacterium hankyongi TaxID=1176532 RepID=A0ABP9A1D6_9FLAO|nr:response regulator [Flavobacterium sp. N1846]
MLKKHFFIVDDDPIAIMILKKLLIKCDFNITPLSFKNGEEALDHFKNNYSSSNQYIVFLDINMPIMNGWEFLNSLETFTTPNTTRVFLVTSSVDETDKIRANQSPFVSRFLSKPLSVATLDELIKVN